MPRLGLAVLLFIPLVACVAHEKNGDRAVALGDWKTAVAEYGAALSKDPETPGLKEKYDRARREAGTSTFKRAQACAAAGDWLCAVSEADYVLSLDPGNSEVSVFRASV